MYKEVIDGTADVSLWHMGEEDVLGSQQRDEDEGGPHCLHVGCGLSTVGDLQLGDQDPDDVHEKKEVHLYGWMVGGQTDVWVDDRKVEGKKRGKILEGKGHSGT